MTPTDRHSSTIVWYRLVGPAERRPPTLTDTHEGGTHVSDHRGRGAVLREPGF